MKVILDSHAFLWAAVDKERLSPKVRRLLTSYDNEVFVSAATAWEIATKFRLGKLPQAFSFVHSFRDGVQRLRFSELHVSVEHSVRAGLLQIDHKDPFDRLLIAQSQAENMPLVSNEKLFDRFLIHRIW